MSRTHGNEKNSSQFTTSVKPIASFLQTRDFAPLQTDLDEDAPLRSSGYSENFLEKIINQRSTESSNTPVQAKPINRLKTLQAQRMGIQAKLNIGEPNDKYEREADHTAVQVVQQINSSSQNQQSVQRDESMENEEKEEEELQMKPDISQIQRHESMEEESEDLQMKSLVQRKDNVGGGEASSDLESSIEGARGSGQSLDASLQEKMGVAMGADFSGVKVHTDSQSDQLNKSIQAKAFTTGQDVFFRQGAYEPSSRGGQELIAHELTHVVQQNGGAVQRTKIQRTEPEDITEVGGVTMNESTVVTQDKFPKVFSFIPDNMKVYELLKQAESLKPKFDAMVKKLAGDTNGKESLAPIKKFERAWEKLEKDYTNKEGERDVLRLIDLCRGSIYYDSVEDLVKGIEALPNAGITIIKGKNKFSKPEATGYRDFNFSIKMDGFICELQMHVKAITDIKPAMHKHYEDQSKLESKAKTLGLDSADQARLAELIAKQKAAYDGAYQQAGGTVK